MTAWTAEDLSTIGNAEELRISSLRPDGTMRPYVTIWVVRSGDDLYVRPAYGTDNPWFARAQASGAGRIRAGGLERDVTFADPPPDAQRGHRRGLSRQVRPPRAGDRGNRGRGEGRAGNHPLGTADRLRTEGSSHSRRSARALLEASGY